MAKKQKLDRYVAVHFTEELYLKMMMHCEANPGLTMSKLIRLACQELIRNVTGNKSEAVVVEPLNPRAPLTIIKTQTSEERTTAEKKARIGEERRKLFKEQGWLDADGEFTPEGKIAHKEWLKDNPFPKVTG